MRLTVEPQPVPLITTPAGVVRITGTRVPLETVVRAFYQGATPEETRSSRTFPRCPWRRSMRYWRTTSRTASRLTPTLQRAPRRAIRHAVRTRSASTPPGFATGSLPARGARSPSREAPRRRELPRGDRARAAASPPLARSRAGSRCWPKRSRRSDGASMGGGGRTPGAYPRCRDIDRLCLSAVGGRSCQSVW